MLLAFVLYGLWWSAPGAQRGDGDRLGADLSYSADKYSYSPLQGSL
jgi:hypothetical protein